MRRAPSPLSPLGLGLVLLFATPSFNPACARSTFEPLHFQSTATITGKIVDQNDAVVSGARITARNLARSVERLTTTGKRGTGIGGLHSLIQTWYGIYTRVPLEIL